MRMLAALQKQSSPLIPGPQTLTFQTLLVRELECKIVK